MLKRRPSKTLSDDDSNEDESRDASFTPKHTVKRARGKTQQNASISSSGIRATPSPHSKLVHIIQDPTPMRTALLKWFQTVHANREMPWRKPYDPNLGIEDRAQRAYEVWISEIMLQQTQVVTVIPYYNRWMAKFPTIYELANATIDEVNALWKGLGYYSRASRLLQGAQKVVKDYGGRLPDNARDLEASIPGIGRYSAGAISSIAYGERAPALDGNVHRLMSRVLALHANPKAKSTLDILWTGAKTMVDTDALPNKTEPSSSEPKTSQYPGDINQALIELGSTMCKVHDPGCASCPIRAWCSAYQLEGLSNADKPTLKDIEDTCNVCEPFADYQGVTTYPMRVDRKKAREELDLVNVIEWHSRADPENRQFLMIRRPESGLLAGLYEFPTHANVSRDTSHTSQEKITTEITAQLEKDKSPSSMSAVKSVGDVLHVFSHIKKTYRVHWIVLEDGGKCPPSLYFSGSEDFSPRKANVKKGAVKIKSAISPKNGRWVPLQEVNEMNMGTGTTKIWNLTRKLWEAEV